MLFKHGASIATIIVSLSSSAWAHPGHGASEADSVVHFIVEPVHCWWILAIVVAVGMAFLYRQVRREKTLGTVKSRRQIR